MQKRMFIAGAVMGGCFLLMGGALPAVAETLPAHPGTRLLKGGQMVVEMDDPNAAAHNHFNREARRFSPMAMVLRAQCNGRSFFYSPVDGGAYYWVGGAPMEFDLGEKDISIP